MEIRRNTRIPAIHRGNPKPDTMNYSKLYINIQNRIPAVRDRFAFQCGCGSNMLSISNCNTEIKCLTCGGKEETEKVFLFFHSR